MAIRQEVNTPLVITIGAISGLLLLVITFGLESWFRYEQDREITAKWQQAHNTPLEKLLAQQHQQISTWRWADAGKTAAAIPIDQAMQAVVKNGGKLPASRPATGPAPK